MSIFKAYDIRGVYPEEINEKIIYKIGRAFVDFLNCKTVVLGRDIRLSSQKLFDALSKGITDQGADVINIGLSSTPMMYYAVHKLKAGGGLVITASHNPKEWNGLKLVREEAKALSGEEGIEDIERRVINNEFRDVDEHGKIIQKDIKNEYIEYVKSYAGNINDFKIVIDCGNGMAGNVIFELLKKLKIKHSALYSEMDGQFPNHTPDPLKEENMKELQKKVMELKSDVGFAFDGDVDRIMLVDEKGNRIPGDITTALIAKNILTKKKGIKIIYDIRASKSVRELIQKNGGTPIVWKAGHSIIKKKMRDEGIEFGGEKSGHYFYKENFYTDSALITMIYVLEMMQKERKKLSELVESINPYSASGEINFEIEDKQGTMKKVEQHYKDAQITHIDGVTIEYPDWWFNLRESNTEPLLRLNLEADSKELMKKKINEVKQLLKNNL